MSDRQAPDPRDRDRLFADEPLANRLRPAIDEARVARVWQQLREAQASQRRGGWLRVVAPMGAVAVVVAAWLLWQRAGAPSGGMLLARTPGITLLPGAELHASLQPETLELRDGSRLQLGPKARLQVLENDGHRFATFLRQGRTHFEVRSGGPRRWTIETELASVEVVGTVFTVEHDRHRLRVAVERGVVMVRGERVPGRVARLVAGEELVVGEPLAATEPPEAAPGLDRAADAATAASSSAQGAAMPATRASSSALPPRATERLQERGLPGAGPRAPAGGLSGVPAGAASVGAAAPSSPPMPAAPAPAPSAPPRRAVAAAPSSTPASERGGSMALSLQHADRLRQLGDAAAAAELLEDGLRAHPTDPAAGMVEFTLGRLYLDRLADPARAARAFAAVLARGSPQPLLEDAMARRCEALWRAGDRAAARAVLAEYRQTYPHGARRSALTALLSSP